MATPETLSAIRDYFSLVQVVVGGLLTFAGGYAGTVMLEKRRHSREARNLALAFRGELIAIRRLVAHRKYLEGLARVIDHMQTPLTLARHTSTFCPRARVAGAGRGPGSPAAE